MHNDGLVAGSSRPVVSKRQSAKTPGSAKRPDTATVRSQLHLGADTVRRLGVHASMVGRNNSRIADEILSSWLARYGKGRELFASIPGDSTDSVESGD